jgi:hypothetical protein
MFSLDENAVIGQPIYLLIAGIVSAVIIVLFLISFQNVIGESQIHMVDHEIDKILTQSTTMFEYANEGTFVSVHVDFPSSMRFIVFGSLPQNGTQQPTNLSLNETTSNNYYYVMADGTIRTGHSNARFSADNKTQVALLHSGSYDLNLELFSDGEKTYVKIY